MSSWWKSTEYSDDVFDTQQLCSIWYQLHKTSLILETQIGFLARSLWLLRSVTKCEKLLFSNSVTNVSAYPWIPCETRTSNFHSATSHSYSTNHNCSSRITPFSSFWTYFGPLPAERRIPSQYSNYISSLTILSRRLEATYTDLPHVCEQQMLVFSKM